MVTFRAATPADAPALSLIKSAVWPDERNDVELITAVLEQPDHRAFVATDSNRAVGFVDGFLTLSETTQRRWEVDLLAVHPDYWGQGLATQLVAQSLESGAKMGAELSRTLIQVDNVGSQTAFARNGFKAAERPLNLWVSTKKEPAHSRKLSEGTHLIPVMTLNYQGVWVEGSITAQSLQAAQSICAHMDWAIAGTIIPTDNNSLNELAQKAGYFFINQYQYWYRKYQTKLIRDFTAVSA